MLTIPSAKSQQTGFTLLEVLLALVIFAMLSLSAYAVLQGVMRNDEVSREKITRLSELQRAFATLARDFTQVIPRPTRINGETSTILFQAERFKLGSEDGAVTLVRAGWFNPGGELRRSELQKVGYRLRQQTLERLTYIYPDAVTGTEPTATPLLSRVTAFSLRFYNNGQWLTQWITPDELPAAVEITITAEDYGTIRRLFLLTGTSDTASSGSRE
ncbi:general secretion pathway protein J [Tolumonas auensis DSM 9187]|uniref:Type II secretion system protein J n=1 Tax=Tolumonas auensis (strain DSM 9187 / NBRC 110442 / TA 4) TaxID=595494 RepID=C4L992_TOLAT|nr:type II secretion system minor pseudopilin GspJ [Tolumonas auensis]ACQ91991.1 general secretion pathway protein J [Tolumonas auensis DSM 9187]